MPGTKSEGRHDLAERRRAVTEPQGKVTTDEKTEAHQATA
jgi:hypothetical protein